MGTRYAAPTTLNELADLYQWTGRYDEAIETADLTLGLKTGLGDPQGQAQALHQLGVVRDYRGDYAQALPLLQRAVGLRQESGDAKGEAWSATYLGLSPFSRAITARWPAFTPAPWRRPGRARTGSRKVSTSPTLARVGLRLGEYEAALAEFEKSLEMKGASATAPARASAATTSDRRHDYSGRYAEAEGPPSALPSTCGARLATSGAPAIASTGWGWRRWGRVTLLRRRAISSRPTPSRRAGPQGRGHPCRPRHLGQARLGLEDLSGATEASNQAMALLAEQKSTEEVQQGLLQPLPLLAAQGDPAAAEFLHKAQRRRRTSWSHRRRGAAAGVSGEGEGQSADSSSVVGTAARLQPNDSHAPRRPGRRRPAPRRSRPRGR